MEETEGKGDTPEEGNLSLSQDYKENIKQLQQLMNNLVNPLPGSMKKPGWSGDGRTD